MLIIYISKSSRKSDFTNWRTMCRLSVSNLFKVETDWRPEVLFFTPFMIHRLEHRQESYRTIARWRLSDKTHKQSCRHRSLFLKNPFSIRNILNLSEEPQDRCAQNTSNQRFPIVPQVVRPLEFGRYTNVEVGLACYRTTQRLSALRNFPPWLLGTHFMRFLPGKWMKTKRCYLVHVHLRNFYTRRVDVSFQPRLKGFLPLCHLRYLLLRWNLRKKRKKIP